MFASMRDARTALERSSGVARTPHRALSVWGLACAGGLLWGGCLLLIGILNRVWPSYGTAFLDVLRSVYPGYGAATGWVGVPIGAVYGALDGAVAGALVAWLYNAVAAPAGTIERDGGEATT